MKHDKVHPESTRTFATRLILAGALIRIPPADSKPYMYAVRFLLPMKKKKSKMAEHTFGSRCSLLGSFFLVDSRDQAFLNKLF
jgi:hypothetical protein